MVPRFHSVGWLGVVVVVGALAVSCGGDAERSDSTGGLRLSLELSSGVQIDEVRYEITSATMSPMGGVIDTSAAGATASVELFGLAADDGYRVTMSAASLGGETSCEGGAEFAVEAGRVTGVMAMLHCKAPPVFGAVRVDGTLNVCAELDKVVVAPLQTTEGAAIEVQASGRDTDGDTVAYRWNATGGSFADPSDAETSFTCGEAAAETITIGVSDDDFEHCIDNWTVDVRCVDAGGAEPAWGTPVLIETDDAGDASQPLLAVDPSGNVTAVWQQSDGSRTHLYANRYTRNGPWGAPVRVSDGTGDARSHQVLVDPKGKVTVVWQQSNGVGSTVYANRYVAGGPWGAALPLGDGVAPRAAVDPSGNVTVVWRYGRTIYATRCSAGGPWGTPVSLNDGLVGNVDFGGPHVVVDPSGNVTAVWRQEYEVLYVGGPLRWGIIANHYSPGGPWGAAVPISEGSLFTNVWTIGDVVVDRFGNVTVTWTLERRASNFLGLFACRYPAGGPWESPVALAGRTEYPAPRLSVDRDGNVMAVFADFPYDVPAWLSSASAQSRPAGGSWENAVSISPDVPVAPTTPQIANVPQVAADPNGSFTAVWQESNTRTEFRFGIWANRYRVDGSWGTAVLISDGATEAVAPQIAVDPQGDVTAMWLQEQTPGGSVDDARDLYAKRIGASGAWGAAVRVSNGAGDAGSHHVVVDVDGNVTTAWAQLDGTRTSIWTNRYE
jgi:hypothetical protein